MVGVTSIQVQESLEELTEKLRQAQTLTVKERLQVLYWLKQEKPPRIMTMAKGIGKHRSTVQTWLSMYRDGGLEAMLEIKKSPFLRASDSALTARFSTTMTWQEISFLACE